MKTSDPHFEREWFDRDAKAFQGECDRLDEHRFQEAPVYDRHYFDDLGRKWFLSDEWNAALDAAGVSRSESWRSLQELRSEPCIADCEARQMAKLEAEKLAAQLESSIEIEIAE